MRVLSRHLTPLDSQVRVSLNISLVSKQEDECLNLKSKWGGSKLPNLAVSAPKGVSKGQTIGAENSKEGQENENKGDKKTREPNGRQKQHKQYKKVNNNNDNKNNYDNNNNRTA